MAHLESLNAAQKTAVTHSPSSSCQILAGPGDIFSRSHHKGPKLSLDYGLGSGKTRTLTSRVAHLVLQHKIQPKDLVSISHGLWCLANARV